jgi:hypothetical protein
LALHSEGQSLFYKGKLNAAEEFDAKDNCQLRIKLEGVEEDSIKYVGGFKENAFDG